MFESKAKATKNEKAIDFLAWSQKKRRTIGRNKDASVLLKVRHIEAHRASVDYHYLVSLHDAVNMSGTIVITSSTFPPVPPHVNPVPVPSALVVAHFQGYPQKPVEIVIENTIFVLNQLISEAGSKFGPP